MKMCRHENKGVKVKAFNHEDTVIKLIHNPCGCSKCRKTVGTVRLCACGIGEFENNKGTKTFLFGDQLEIQINTEGEEDY